MADAQIVAGGTSAAPLAYTVPGAAEILLKTGFAQFDGTAAVSSWFPCLKIIAPGGKTVAEYITQDSVAAGGSADVTFGPFLGRGGGGAGSGGGTTTAIADIAFVNAGAEAEGSGVTSLTVNTPAGLQFHDLLIVVFGFENVAAGSGPYISDTSPFTGWSRVLSQAPVGGNGTGIEVWAAVWETGTSTPFNFFASRTVVAREVAYRNNADTVATAITVTASSAVAGDNVVCPTITTTVPKSFVVPIAGQALAAGTFVYPGTYTRRFDNARGGASGNAEIAEGDALQTAPGASGTVTLTNSSAGGTARGATATLAINPLVTVSQGVGGLLGLTSYTPVADSTINTTTSTSLVAVDATNAVIAFTAPDSGNVLLRVSALVDVNNNSNPVYLGLLDGSTKVAEGYAFNSPTGIASSTTTMRSTVTLRQSGLTPGHTYGYKFAFRVGGAATTAHVYAGPADGPIVIEAWAAP